MANGGASRQPNKTGLPDGLKAGLEKLSGYAMDDVRVHYGSQQPARLQAHAYAQGTAIHLASGQAKHLPHEAWHVVQQKQGRVRPTFRLGGEAINDDAGLEREADVMGARANRPAAGLAAPVGSPHCGDCGCASCTGSSETAAPVARRALSVAGYVQRIAIDGLAPDLQTALVAAYRADASNGDMWGRESDIAALAIGLGIRIHVLNFSADPSAPGTDNVQTYGGGGRPIYLHYSGDHYDVLEPAQNGLYANATIGQRFRRFPIPGNGNCLFAAIWQAAKTEAETARRVADPDGNPISSMDEGQRFLRAFCHGGDAPLVPEAAVLQEIAAMDDGLSDEHIGPHLTAGLLPYSVAPEGDAGQVRRRRKKGRKHRVKKKKKPPASALPVAPLKAAVLSAKEATARLAKFKSAPDYWATLAWTPISEYAMKANLPREDPLFAAIQASVSAGIANQPYVSGKGESTRMEVVEKAVAALKAKKKLSEQEVAKLKTLERRLTEKQRGGAPPPRSRPVEIDRIEVIANQRLWNAYQAANQSIRADLTQRRDTDPLNKVKFAGAKDQTLDDSVGEKRLFHASSPEILDMIETGGFNPAYSANKAKPGEKPRYGPLGQGAYFADVMSKAMTYTQCPVCSDYDCQVHKEENSEILLSRVLLGHVKKAHSFLQPGNLRGEDLSMGKAGRHSVYSEGIKGSKNLFTAASGLNEYAVRQAAQTYPEFRIYYKTK